LLVVGFDFRKDCFEFFVRSGLVFLTLLRLFFYFLDEESQVLDHSIVAAVPPDLYVLIPSNFSLLPPEDLLLQLLNLDPEFVVFCFLVIQLLLSVTCYALNWTFGGV
jgi:hypothetical protein